MVGNRLNRNIVTTCLVVLSSRFYFWKNWLRRQISRQTVISTTDRRGGLVPKHLDFWSLGTEIVSLNFVTEWQDGPSQVWRAVTDPSVKSSLWTLWQMQQDGPSQARRTVTNLSTELTLWTLWRTVTVMTDRHRLRNPNWVGILLKFLRGVLDYSCL